MDITPNIVQCPNCKETFQHDRVNGLALIELASSINARKKMQCRLTLNDLEREYGGEIPHNVRKLVLDGYNELARGIATLIGYGTEAE